jgi:hypothetical protein
MLAREVVMIADTLLSRLDAVKQMGRDRWLARCPAHDDRHPSLSVREADGERVLLKCWSGCTAADVLAAVGLQFDALYPPRSSHHHRGERRPFPAVDVLRAVSSEALIVAVAGSHLANGGTLSDEDRARLLIAAERIATAVRESGHA